jgi:hypothetical protein
MANTRLYKVDTPAGPRLVEASNPSRAVAHVAKSLFTVSIPVQHEIYKMATEGVLIEIVGAKQVSDETRNATSQSTIEV